MVDPYIIIISPALKTPTLIASAAASIVPEVTVVPSAKPVCDAADFEILPIISFVQTNFGNLLISIIPSFSSSLQSCLFIS